MVTHTIGMTVNQRRIYLENETCLVNRTFNLRKSGYDEARSPLIVRDHLLKKRMDRKVMSIIPPIKRVNLIS